ncbi:DUF2620 family protein [Georgenia sp. AZ-5]|uniref:DUF2620 family protein n=1 Tax=Georgenia sp. AZ-5 TaxID=3367526 RepID=UPI003755040D
MRFVTYGMGRERVVGLIRSVAPPGSVVEALSDFQAANDVRAGQADVAIGVCQSGAGGALAIPMALLGAGSCAQLSTPSKQPTGEEIREAVASGKKVFGLALSHVDTAIPTLVQALSASPDRQ